MASQQQQRRNGSGGQSKRPARNDLELKDNIVTGADGIPVLEHVNLGVGNYETDDYWQQVRSYRRGLYLYAAYGSAIEKRAVQETKRKLGREGWNAEYDEVAGDVEMHDPVDVPNIKDLDPETVTPDDSRRRQEMARGEEIWRKLGDSDQALSATQEAAMEAKTGVTPNWLPISWKMVVGRHEASRSKGAELVRDVFTDVSDLRTGDDGNAKDLFGGT